jgi:hypothetical protein
LPQNKYDIVFFENGWTSAIPPGELFSGTAVKRVSFDDEPAPGGVLAETAREDPRRVVLLGILSKQTGTAGDMASSITRLVSRVRRSVPRAAVYVQSIYRCNDNGGGPRCHEDPEEVRRLNSRLAAQAVAAGYVFIEVSGPLCDATGLLRRQYAGENGLSVRGCMMWKHLLYPYLYGLQPLPSLVPMPRRLRWTNAPLPLYAGLCIRVKDRAMRPAAASLAGMLGKMDIAVIKDGDHGRGLAVVELCCGKVRAPLHEEEAYRIDIDEHKAVLTAGGPHGAFNAVQTLRQLMRDATFLPGCHITDWPAFSWRGYMVDVARNYQSLTRLKQQAEMMSRYKMNVLHLHLTDDVAWRLQSSRYPALTAAENMLRDKGRFYSRADIAALISYCRKRFITLVPEIDVPGHSDAFTRTFGLEMQSSQGSEILSHVLEEICELAGLPFIHLGTDETTVTNPDFIDAMVALLRRRGKKVIGWSPGIQAEGLILQLWGTGSGRSGNAGCIDSRGLYLNHLDPLAGVVGVFGKKLGGRRQGSERVKGGEICLWNDRKAAREKDLLRMNPVYPCMLAFAERSWVGGGFTAFTMAMGRSGSSRHRAFAAFEKRLLDQQRQYFRGRSFPYVEQGNISWRLFGPFDNEGDLKGSFWPETADASLALQREGQRAAGGTVILRHWWYPAIGGWLDHPRENTTFYGWRRFRREAGGPGFLWAGFNEPSRSTATDAPEPGSWDSLHSRLWFNGRPVPPPPWKHGSAAGNSEIPLVDEGYFYRPPASVIFKKGWNEILVKAPVGSFAGSDWQNPVKWMFTAVCVRRKDGGWYRDE